MAELPLEYWLLVWQQILQRPSLWPLCPLLSPQSSRLLIFRRPMLASSYLIFEANHFKGMWADFTVTTPGFRISVHRTL